MSWASKTKGFILEPMFDLRRQFETSIMTEAVHLYATSEVKMEARFEILGKFCTRYQFASYRHSRMEQPKNHTYSQPYPSSALFIGKVLMWHGSISWSKRHSFKTFVKPSSTKKFGGIWSSLLVSIDTHSVSISYTLLETQIMSTEFVESLGSLRR